MVWKDWYGGVDIEWVEEPMYIFTNIDGKQIYPPIKKPKFTYKQRKEMR